MHEAPVSNNTFAGLFLILVFFLVKSGEEFVFNVVVICGNIKDNLKY